MKNWVSFGLCVLLCALIAACKKEDNVEVPKEFPVDLDYDHWVEGSTRLFSNKKEITDTAVIRAFEAETQLTHLMEQFTQEGSPELQSLQFVSETGIRFYPGLSSGAMYDVARKGTRFLFYAPSTYGINPAASPDEESLGFLYNMLKYVDRLGDPASNGLRQTREVRVAHGNFKVLKLSAFAYTFRMQQQNLEDEPMVDLVDGLIFNEFDADVLKFVGPTDTLAIKEYELIFSLRK